MTTGNRTNNGIDKPYKLLIADDQPQILEALRLLLKPEGYQLEMVRTPALLIEALAHESFDGVLIDLNYTRDTTSGQEGMDLVGRIKEIDPQLPIVVMTAWGNIDLAVEAMRRGASDFIQKPWENPRLLSSGVRNGSKRRIAFCVPLAHPISSPPRHRCARCWRPCRVSAPPTPMCSSPESTARAKKWWHSYSIAFLRALRERWLP